MSPSVIVVADYADEPAEGMQIVSGSLVNGLRKIGYDVRVVRPRPAWRALLAVFRAKPKWVVFTHGPGTGVVAISLATRALSSSNILWIATRPDLGSVPRLLRGRATAHAVICNQPTDQLAEVAWGAQLHPQFIGIDPERLRLDQTVHEWPDLRAGVPVILHVGHLKRNRGLDLLVDAKMALGDRIEIVVQGGPTVSAEPSVVADLADAGVHIRQDYVRSMGALYASCDLYVFPARPEEAGAIELPLSILEAVACRRPVLTNRFGAVEAALSTTRGVQMTEPHRFVQDLEAWLAMPRDADLDLPGLEDDLNADRVTETVSRIIGDMA